ncbi:MAG: calcium/sodium antiporter [Thermoguttaceae bacterium]|nr:calcium/sodium antiporter [Thermoguttaceae bacterium]
MLIVHFLILIVGFYALIKGADVFVDGSAALAKNFRIPSLIIGLTIVALGTSAPELAVSLSAALQGSNEIALSNVIGSNIFNLLCILGACAFISSVPVGKDALRRDYPVTIAATLFALIMIAGPCLLNGKLTRSAMYDATGTVSRITGAVLLIAFVAYIVQLIVEAKKNPVDDEIKDNLATWKCFAFIVVGLIMIAAGGKGVVYSAQAIARAAGVTETLIGLTIVALGTSLPEFVTSLVAARKGQTELAIGNVLGSNIFNLMFVLGTSALIRPIEANAASLYDLAILAAVSVLAYVFAFTRRRVGRSEGAVMIAIYIGYVVFAAMR